MTNITGFSLFSKHKMEILIHPLVFLMMNQCQGLGHWNLILLTQIQKQKSRHDKTQDPARMQTQTYEHATLQSHI